MTVLKEARPKPKDAPIEVLGSTPEDRKHEDLCIINAKGGQTIINAKNSSDLLDKMREDARKCGADAIIIRDSEDRTWQVTGGFEQAKSSVLAIRFLWKMCGKWGHGKSWKMGTGTSKCCKLPSSKASDHGLVPVSGQSL